MLILTALWKRVSITVCLLGRGFLSSFLSLPTPCLQARVWFLLKEFQSPRKSHQLQLLPEHMWWAWGSTWGPRKITPSQRGNCNIQQNFPMPELLAFLKVRILAGWIEDTWWEKISLNGIFFKHFIIAFCIEVSYSISWEPSLDILTYCLFNSEINTKVLINLR